MPDNPTPEESLQETARQLHAKQSSIEETLAWMIDNGSSLILDWGEDSHMWECSWISGGERFTGLQKEIRLAILQSLNQCFGYHCKLGGNLAERA